MPNLVRFAFSLGAALLLPASSGAAQYAKGPWRLTVEEGKGILSIGHARLGAVLNAARLQVRQGNRLASTTGWTVADRGAQGIAITSTAPVPATWEFRTAENAIEVRTAAEGSAIAALAPATAQRIPARLAEADKMVATMTAKPGTVDYTYTGQPMEEKSYTPPHAGEVMYLALGPVDALNVHALFDRPTDIAIRFAETSRLERDPADAQRMQVTTPIGGGATLVSLIPDYYVKVLGNPRYVPFDDTYHKTAPTGWNHWLAFFDGVTEQDIVSNTDWIAAHLKDYGMAHVQLDEGYQDLQHRAWVKEWNTKKFPHGPEWLASYIKSKGFVPGYWSVPYCYRVEDGKPEWFLRDEKGHIAMDYQGGGELDFSRPDVLREYWIPLLKTMKEQGWGYFKFDMGSTVPQWEKNKSRFYDKSKTPYDLTVETLKIFRDIMGPEIWLTNHPDNWGGRMGFLDVVGCGHDPGPGWKLMNYHFSVISNNTYQNHIIWYSDPDCIVLRDKPTRSDAGEKNREFFNLEEARTAASLLSITGLQWLSGDDMPGLEPDRVELIKKAIPILPIFPIDLFGRGRDREHYPRIFDLKVNMPSGKYDVAAVTNWSEKAATRTVSFEKDLGLSGGGTYVVFDFWKEQLVGAAQGSFQSELPAHGTAVFAIHPLAGTPRLIANNRHLTGAFGIQKQRWTAASRTLEGVSETVPGVRYALFFHVPKGISVAKVGANAAGIEHNLQPDGLLKVSFVGQKAPVEWSVTFAK